jgi:hypothetical protein
LKRQIVVFKVTALQGLKGKMSDITVTATQDKYQNALQQLNGRFNIWQATQNVFDFQIRPHNKNKYVCF